MTIVIGVTVAVNNHEGTNNQQEHDSYMIGLYELCVCVCVCVPYPNCWRSLVRLHLPGSFARNETAE